MDAAGLPIFSVRDYGAIGDGLILDTTAIQSAIDACTANAGGTVFFPTGIYLTGTIRIKDNVTLYFAPEARLLGSTDLKNYKLEETGLPYSDTVCLILGHKARNFGLAGKGTVDGQGRYFPCGTEGFNAEDEEKAPIGEAKIRPMLAIFNECQGITINDLTLQNAACYCALFKNCRDIKIHAVKVDNRANQNTDGFHLLGCENVFISDCDMSCGDDIFPLSRSARNIVITNCVLTSRWAAFRMGPDSTGVFKDIAVSNCVIHDTYGAAIKLQMVEGGVMENISFNNIVLDRVTGPISIRLAGYLGWKMERKESLPVGKFRNVTFSNIRGSVPDNSYPLPHEVVRMPGEKRSCINITGLEGHPVEGITFSNIHLTYAGGGTKEEANREVPELKDHYPEYHMFGILPAYGLYARHVHGLKLDNVSFDLESEDLRPAIVCDDVNDLELSDFEAAGSLKAKALIRIKQCQDVFIHSSRPANKISRFIYIEGKDSKGIHLAANQLQKSKTAVKTSKGVRKDAVSIA